MARRTPANEGRAVLYRRVSALMGRSGEDFHSPDMQLDAMRRAIGTAGLHEVDVIDDIDVSGRSFSRKGIDRIRAMVEQRQVDVVAVYDLSRLGRNLAESLTFVKWLRKHGVSVMSTQERFDDTPEGQFMLGQFLGLAELYSDQMGRRWSEIIARRAKRGQTHGPPALGYTEDDDGNTVPDPIVGPAVTAAFRAYADGKPIARIAEAIRVAVGRPIDRRVVKRLLGNGVYLGRVAIQSKVAGAIDIPGRHDPLVDETTWRRVQRRLAADAVTPARYLAPAHALTGLGVCDDCEHRLGVKVNWERDAKTDQRVHVARLHCDYGRFTGGCQGVGTPRCTAVEAVVLAEIASYAAHLRDDRPAPRRGAPRSASDPARIERELAQARAAMARLSERWARKRMPDDAYDSAMANLQADEARLTGLLAAVEAPVEEESPATMLGLAEELLTLWPDMLPDERNRALRSVVIGVRMRRATRWREPDEDRVVGVEFRFRHGYGE